MVKETSICETCHKSFSFYRSTLRGKTGRFCSRKCIRLTPHNKGKIEWKECLNCGKPVRKWNKYCGEACYHEAVDCRQFLPKNSKPWNKNKKMPESYKEKLSGKNHWNWQGGKSTENLKERMRFVQEIGKLVMKRDNYACVLCGAENDLQVDHIQSWAEYVELRFNIDNCRTLCRKCHYFITYNKQMPIGSNWGKYHFNYKERSIL